MENFSKQKVTLMYAPFVGLYFYAANMDGSEELISESNSPRCF